MPFGFMTIFCKVFNPLNQTHLNKHLNKIATIVNNKKVSNFNSSELINLKSLIKKSMVCNRLLMSNDPFIQDMQYAATQEKLENLYKSLQVGNDSIIEFSL
jgi:hypothetical protein